MVLELLILRILEVRPFSPPRTLQSLGRQQERREGDAVPMFSHYDQRPELNSTCVIVHVEPSDLQEDPNQNDSILL